MFNMNFDTIKAIYANFNQVKPFVYGIVPLAGTDQLLALGTGNRQIVLGTEDFIVFGLQGTSTGSCLLQIQSSNQSFNWMNRGIDFDSIVGDGKQNLGFAFPYVLKGTQTLDIQITDTSNAANNVYLAFVGVKVFSVDDLANN